MCGKEDGESECLLVMRRIENILTERGQTSVWSYVARELAEFLKGEMQNVREIVCIFKSH